MNAGFELKNHYLCEFFVRSFLHPWSNLNETIENCPSHEKIRTKTELQHSEDDEHVKQKDRSYSLSVSENNTPHVGFHCENRQTL